MKTHGVALAFSLLERGRTATANQRLTRQGPVRELPRRQLMARRRKRGEARPRGSNRPWKGMERGECVKNQSDCAIQCDDMIT